MGKSLVTPQVTPEASRSPVADVCDPFEFFLHNKVQLITSENADPDVWLSFLHLILAVHVTHAFVTGTLLRKKIQEIQW